MEKVTVTYVSKEDVAKDIDELKRHKKWKEDQKLREEARKKRAIETEKRRQAMLEHADHADRRIAVILGDRCVDCGTQCGYGVYICVNVGTSNEHNRAPYWNKEQDVNCIEGKAELLCPTCCSIRRWQKTNPKRLELLT